MKITTQRLPAPFLSLVLVICPFTVVYWRIHGLISKGNAALMANQDVESHFDEANAKRMAIAMTLISDGSYLKSEDFEGFNNETGVDHFIAPNIIHYIRLNTISWKFVEYVCLRSAYLHQQPDYIFIHTNAKAFKGKYWNWILNEEDFSSRIVILLTEAPTEIFGQPLNPDFALHHGSDITRIRALMAYGGIFT